MQRQSLGGGHIPVEPGQQQLPDPIPPSYYARPGPGEARRSWSALDLPRRAIHGFTELPLQQQVMTALVCLAVLVAAVVAMLALTSTGSPGGDRQQALALAPPGTSAPGLPASSPTITVTQIPSPVATPRRLPATPRPSPAPPTPVTINGNLTAHRGDQVTLDVSTAPKVSCTLTISYQGAPPPSSTPSNATGSASWTWDVGSNAPIGTWPLQVTCGSGSANATITIKRGEG